jgi:NAD(P)-dependent dehydrogenase (short-subunit alcohol dehydrogenase family)
VPGPPNGGDFFALTEEDWQDGFALNFHGYVRMTRAAWPHLRESAGRIVNIVGIGSPADSAEFTIGGSVDAAFECTKAMAHNGIPQGVGVNAINPRAIETDRFSRNVERVMRDRGLSRDEALIFPVSSHGTTRLGRPEEIGCLLLI